MAAAAAAASSSGSSGSSLYAVSEEKTNGTRLTRLLVDGGTHVLRKVLHSVHPLATLQHVLNSNFSRLQRLKSRRVIFNDQWEKLFPSPGDPPDSKTFDISLLHLLLREICHLTAPPTGWHDLPADDDVSLEANIVRIKCFRNELCHSVSTGIAKDKFEDKWNIVSSALVALGLDQTEIDRLKTEPVDHDSERRIEEEVNKWKLETEPRLESLEDDVLKLKGEMSHIQGSPSVKSELSSCLPDEICMFGRTQEIQQVIEFVQSGTVGVVLITGGPGFGKTTVANKAAHELSRLDCERAVLFCSFRSTKIPSEAATLMALACSKNQTQPPENPKLWLLNWSKQTSSRVTFVLDNADEVLEDGDCINDFLNLLESMRRFSGQNVTFIITSRMVCSTTSLQCKNVRLACLPVEDAKQIFLSRVADSESQSKLSKVEKLVALCGFVPLALQIAGSVVSHYSNEDEFLQCLEDEPLDVLQDGRRSTDQTSVEKSIKISFDILNEVEQKALVLLCVFPGSFNSDAAKSLIAHCTTKAKSVSVLQELIDRSLVEQLRTCRYEIHPFIQTFVQKIASAKYPALLDRGKKLACAHFVSRLADNADLYWGLDTCKQSVDSFNEDRHNFEYFVQVYAEMRSEIEDQVSVKSCKTFLDDLPQKCRYLEMCILPRFYISVLERLLKTFGAESQPVHRVELLCLLGHEARKVGDKSTCTAKYDDYMDEAKKLYEERITDFKTYPLSEVIYLNSFARFLIEGEKLDEAKKVYLRSLQICQEKIPEHPERAATLLFAGRLHKKTESGRGKMKQAWQLFSKCVGEHFMTALCPKQLADSLFSLGNKTEALSYYQQALEMMEKLGLDGHKESIMTLRNYGVCQKMKGNFEKARNLLREAERVAEIELDKDHRWKVMVKTELALLYEEEGKIDQMEEAVTEGLNMCYRLGQTAVEKHGADLRKILNRHLNSKPK